MAIKLTLLTHEREVERPTNTGRLLLDHQTQLLAEEIEVEQIVWGRKTPNDELVKALATEQCALLYPQGEPSLQISQPEKVQHWVILDGTWQEAHKMWRQSEYLKQTNWFALSDTHSRYNLRRNQRSEGLCTVESAMSLLHFGTYSESIYTLNLAFENFISQRPI